MRCKFKVEEIDINHRVYSVKKDSFVPCVKLLLVSAAWPDPFPHALVKLKEELDTTPEGEKRNELNRKFVSAVEKHHARSSDTEEKDPLYSSSAPRSEMRLEVCEPVALAEAMRLKVGDIVICEMSWSGRG